VGSRNIIRTTKKLIRAYAAHDDDGRVRRCVPTEEEIARGNWKPGGKILFTTENAAEQFAKELHAAGGPLPQAPYECPRRGHFHVTTGVVTYYLEGRNA
jgi:hypothetical protein